MHAFTSHMTDMNEQTQVFASKAGDNPLLAEWSGPFGVAAFGRIKPEHFRPAFARAFAAHAAEVAAIAGSADAPTFANTIDALESSGEALTRAVDVFDLLAGAHTNDAILAVERELAPFKAKHWDRILMDEALFGRIDTLYRTRERLALSAEQRRVLERYHLKFTRAGAALDAAAKARLADINERLATLGTTFSQNVLADEQSCTLVLDGEDDLAGLPDFVRAAARAAAEERGLAGKHAVTTSRSSVEPFLQFSARRDLREKIFRAWIARGDGGGANDNKAIIAEMVALRAERARLLGYATFAHYRLDDTMAKTPQAVRALLERVWAPGRRRALADRDDLQALVQAEGKNFALAPWDWRYYAEKLRKARCDIDEAAIKPYLQLERIIEAAFYAANRLFGLFFDDYFARTSKHSGAWMTTLRDQEKLRGDIHPLVVNVMNFSKAGEGDP